MTRINVVVNLVIQSLSLSYCVPCVWFQDLDRHVNNLMKNHKHEVGIERAHHKETQKKAKVLESEVELLKEKLKVWFI